MLWRKKRKGTAEYIPEEYEEEYNDLQTDYEELFE